MADSSAPPSASIRLMLVDDHPLVRDGLRVRLEAVPGFTVVGEASNAEEAHAQLDALRPTLVLMDVGMKGVNGIELTAALLAREPSLLVLMLSMYDNPEYVQRAMQAGARGYVLKDSPASEIIAAIEAIAGGGTFLSPAVSKRLFRNQTPRPLLSARESEILSALARGLASKQIAREMDVSVRTVEAHRQSIKRKLGLEGQAELIKYAVEHAGTRD
jgi:DNA-binding NarL/FixJ family response regulator